METGILSIPAQQYFASAATSNSDLKYMASPYTPAHFRAYKDGLMEREETEAMAFGTLTHRCILEPETVAGAFAVKPEGMNLATKDGKEWRDAQKGKSIVTQKNADMLHSMIKSVWAHPAAKRIIQNSDRERSLFVEDKGLFLKSRIDCLPKSGNLIADLKTIELCDLDSVEAAIYKYQYYRQAAFYLRVAGLLGLDKSRFVFIFVEKTPPYCVATYEADSQCIELGNMEIECSLTMLRNCVETGNWPGRDDEINQASIPQWALKKMASVL